MKLKNILISLAVIISSLFVVSNTVKADAPSGFTINASDLQMLYGSNYLGHGSTLNFNFKKNSSGQIVYCTEIHDSMPVSGSASYSYSRQADSRIASVLANGYPNKSITGNAYKDYYITGLAVWYLISPSDSVFTHFNLSAGTYKGYSSDVVQNVAKLVNNSGNYGYSSNNDYLTTKINISSLKGSMDSRYVMNIMEEDFKGDSFRFNSALEFVPIKFLGIELYKINKFYFKTNNYFQYEHIDTKLKEFLLRWM